MLQRRSGRIINQWSQQLSARPIASTTIQLLICPDNQEATVKFAVLGLLVRPIKRRSVIDRMLSTNVIVATAMSRFPQESSTICWKIGILHMIKYRFTSYSLNNAELKNVYLSADLDCSLDGQHHHRNYMAFLLQYGFGLEITLDSVFWTIQLGVKLLASAVL